METVAAFVLKRQEAWEALDRLLAVAARGELSLEGVREVDRLYRKASSDLACAQAFYPGTQAHLHLNQLCARAYAQLYRPERDVRGPVWRFFREGFPRAVRAERGRLALSAALLAVGVAWGAALTTSDPASAEWLLPDAVRGAIREHRMWTDGLLSAAPSSYFAASIATNNITVAITAFASGILLGLGPCLLLFYNGLSLGAISAACVQHGMGRPLLGFVCAHGPVELSAIALAGAAGLGLGSALLDPGELPRAVVLRERARIGAKLVVGAAPFLAGIAMVEGFVSPGAVFAPWLKAALGLALGLAFWGYLLTAGRPDPTGARPAGSRAR